MKKMWKMILLIVSAVILAAAVFCGILIYRIAHPTPAVSGNGKKKIICVGDSITYGQGVVLNRKATYESYLSGLLGSEYSVVNYGISNRNAQTGKGMPYTEENLYQLSREEDADIVILMLGTNDSKSSLWDGGKFLEDYENIIESYKDMESRPQVYVMLPPHLFNSQEKEDMPNEKILSEEVIPRIQSLIEKTGVKEIDLFTLTQGHPEWFMDGVHPNAAGNRRIAEEIAEVLQRKY